MTMTCSLIVRVSRARRRRRPGGGARAKCERIADGDCCPKRRPLLLYGKSSESKQSDDGLFTVQSFKPASALQSPGPGPARARRAKSHERTAPRRTPRERASATMAAVMPALPWCTNCQEEVEAETNESNGFTCVRARARVARASRCISFRPPRARMNSRARPPILTVPPPSLSQLLHAMW